MTNEEKEIKWKYSTKPIGKIVKKETYPTGIEFTVNLNLKDLSEEETSDLIKYINKYGLFKDNILTQPYKRGFEKVDIRQVDIMCQRINTQTKNLELPYDDKMKEELEKLFWDIQILLRTMENEIEGRREKEDRGE